MTFLEAVGDWRVASLSTSRALAQAVSEAVLDGRLAVGSTLPSERSLAAMLGLSRGTVVAALDQLRAADWVRTQHGSGSVLRLPARLDQGTAPRPLGRDVEVDLTQAITAAPIAAYLSALDRAAARLPALLVDTGAADAGLPVLREALAERYTRNGLATTADQILVTTGAMAALALVTEHLYDARRPVLVENPTFPDALAILRRRRTRLLSTPVTPDGWEGLEQALGTTPAHLAYLTPDFHNPTGALMNDRLRRRIGEISTARGITLVVDETLRDLDLRTPAEPFAHVPGPQVVLVGSASKVFWSGLRVGWIRTSSARVRALLADPMQTRYSPAPLEQLVVAELMADDDMLLTQRRAALRRQRDHLVALVEARDDLDVTSPPGGLSTWVRLHRDTAPALTRRLREQGVGLTAGPRFSVDGTHNRHVRIPFTADEATLTRVLALV